MNQMTPNMEFMKILAWSIIAPKQTDYSEDIFKDIVSNYPHLIVTHPKITNQNRQQLKCTVMASVYDHGPCIVYLHALGSNRTEGMMALKYLPKQFSLVVFDFSGAGKSEGQYISYGNKEKQDVQSVLNFLRQEYKFRNFVLWGRSMGAVTAITHCQKYNPQDISLLVLDSPFFSFQSMVKQIIQQKLTSTPEFMLDSLITLLKYSCHKIQYSPFKMNMVDLSFKTPGFFIYSQSDRLVDCSHAFKLMQEYNGSYESIHIQEDHNQTRKVTLYIEVIKQIEKSIDAFHNKGRSKALSLLRRSRGINLTLDNSFLKDSTHRLNTQRTHNRNKL